MATASIPRKVEGTCCRGNLHMGNRTVSKWLPMCVQFLCFSKGARMQLKVTAVAHAWVHCLAGMTGGAHFLSSMHEQERCMQTDSCRQVHHAQSTARHINPTVITCPAPASLLCTNCSTNDVLPAHVAVRQFRIIKPRGVLWVLLGRLTCTSCASGQSFRNALALRMQQGRRKRSRGAGGSSKSSSRKTSLGGGSLEQTPKQTDSRCSFVSSHS